MKTLLLVDLQNDFVPAGALAVNDGHAVVPIANRLMSAFDLVVATQDWHPPDHGSFASQHPGRSVGDTIELAGLPQILWPDHCIQGTLGADFVAALNTTEIDRVFPKGTDVDYDSYSGFFDTGQRKSTGLHQFLQERQAGPLFVMGLATDYCVKFTVLDALKLGFETFLIVDGCRGVELQPGDVDKALEAMQAAGVSCIESREVT